MTCPDIAKLCPSVTPNSQVSLTTVQFPPLIERSKTIRWSESIREITILSYLFIKPILKPNKGLLVKISIKEFNFSVIFLANSSLFILLIARFISGINGSSDITYFNYSFVLLNVILTSVILTHSQTSINFKDDYEKKEINVLSIYQFLE